MLSTTQLVRGRAAIGQALSDSYFPNEVDAPSECAMRLGRVDLGPCRIIEYQSGDPIAVASDHPGAYAVNIALLGRIQVSTTRESLQADSGEALVCSPDTPTRVANLVTHGRVAGVGVRLDGDHLRQVASRTLDQAPSAPPRRLDLRSGAGPGWLAMVRSIYAQVGAGGSVTAAAAVKVHLAAALTTSFVLAFWASDEEPARLRPRVVHTLVEALRQDPARPWSALEMARVSGVSVRRVQQAFRGYVGVSPSQYLRDLRLEHARADLIAEHGAATVVEICYRWGFTHPGRFAAEYRRKYGVSPSATRHDLR